MNKKEFLPQAIKQAQDMANKRIQTIAMELAETLERIPVEDKDKPSQGEFDNFKQWLTDSVNYLIEVWVKSEFRINAYLEQSFFAENYPKRIRDFGIEPYSTNEMVFDSSGRIDEWKVNLFLDNLLILPSSIISFLDRRNIESMKSITRKAVEDKLEKERQQEQVKEKQSYLQRTKKAISEGLTICKQQRGSLQSIATAMTRKHFPEIQEIQGRTKYGQSTLTPEFKKRRDSIRKSIPQKCPHKKNKTR